jgi:putative cardiolipin synthase
MRHLLVAILLWLVAGCAALPPLEGRHESFALTGTQDTRLGQATAPLAAAHPGKSGIHPLPLAPDAFAARVLLAAAAQRSVDAQYYIWHDDQTGLLMLEALVSAARRGVRVRMLIDDQNTKGMDELLAAVAGEPNLEMRLYNPFAQRSARALAYFGDFERLNRRMHNKAFIADNQAAIVGGRNIGNEYFGAGTEVPFKDLDVIAIGAAVRDVSAEFDLYWNSASAYPAAPIVGAAGPHAPAYLTERFAAARADPESRAYLDAVRDTPLIAGLLERRLEIEWANAHLVCDDPAKTLDPHRTDVLLLSQLMEGAERPAKTLDIISPYFVPGERGAEFLERLAGSGVRVRVLTNSLAATDVGVVHSGYSKRRCGLARAGVLLFELKPTAGAIDDKKAATGSSSGASLHAKTYAADKERIFVGSFNFDPRSALLNTEMGLVIASPALAGRLARTFDDMIPRNAYEVRARSEGECIEWIERTDSGEVRHETEPETSWLRRTWVAFVALFAIDWLL